MRLADLLLAQLADPGAGAVLALVGAGGKTAALYGLAGELRGRHPDGVLMTSTTHLFDPRREPGREPVQLLLAPVLAEPAAAGPGQPDPGGPAPDPADPRPVLLAALAEPDSGKLRGIHPSRVAGLRRRWGLIVVEADGAKRLPVKAPAGHEPVVPAEAGLVLGLVGLDCLGRPMDAATVHRPERFAAVTGCAPGEPIRLEHLAVLATAPDGLFRGAPAGARRVLALNKADLAAERPADLLARLGPLPGVDLTLVCALHALQPEARVLGWTQ